MQLHTAVEYIAKKIYFIRGHKVMIDADLAQLYGVEAFNLNKSVKRNLDRFPSDFMFQLSQEEFNSLIFQIGISKKGRGDGGIAPMFLLNRVLRCFHQF